MQATSDSLAGVAKKQDLKGASGARSGCPVSVSLERFGDRWSLLLIRDMMVRGYRTFKEFQQSGEGIATNTLADRLERLRDAGIIGTERDEADARRVFYRLTEKGIDLAPVMLELLVWAARWEETAAPCEVMKYMEANGAGMVEEVRRRWRERDLTPFLPPFASEENEAGCRVSKSRRGAPVGRSRITKGAKK
ncbi:MAG TPA: helix-turn-helix domain-containing protein [Silvibacterium sp.]|nr:helix-turn-helix domain-containing protein [Silvibacterium sp.]